jgi:hypothetical protein
MSNSNFKLELEGMDLLKSWAKQDKASASKAIPDITSAIMLFHHVLEDRVNKVFTDKNMLGSVMIGKNVANSKVGDTLMRFSLQYRDKAEPLSNFKHIEQGSDAISTAPLRIPTSNKLAFVKWTVGQWSKQIAINVQSGKLRFGLKNKQLAYLNKNNLRARAGEATWEEYPTKGSEGKRAKTIALWGPSLSAQAKGVFDHDATVKRAADKMSASIINALVKYY